MKEKIRWLVIDVVFFGLLVWFSTFDPMLAAIL